ncbi:MAG: methionyl-tRNA formyltransferase [Thermosynechococcaceae cyanobacterium MS004]|nr:methionyl-tRNA formyltransferase [Thermosynechococcaceae cyanobacterium MS004]
MLKLIFWGTPQFAVPSLEKLIADPLFDVIGVVTQPDKRRGRGSQLIPSPIKQAALAHDITIWQPTRVKKDAQVLAELRSQQADAFVVVAYGQILSPEILEMPRLGCINAHGSLLPSYRGAAPIQWSLYHGDRETGVTTMLMDAGMDTGPMLLKQVIPVELLDNTATLAGKLAQVSATLLVETLQQLDQGSIEPEPQDDGAASYARLLEKADFLIHWSTPAIALHNQIRAFTPSTAQFREQSLKILATVPLDLPWRDRLPLDIQAVSAEASALDAAPHEFSDGSIVFVAKNYGPVVKTGEGLLLLQSVQLAGKRQQSGWDFANGLRLKVGDRFEDGVLSQGD